MLNVGNPGEAFRLAALPNDGVGLARIEFIIGSFVRIHPLALLHPERIADPAIRSQIDTLTEGYADPVAVSGLSTSPLPALSSGFADVHHRDPGRRHALRFPLARDRHPVTRLQLPG